MSPPQSQFRRSLDGLLRIGPGEGTKTALMFGILFTVVGSFIIGRVARDSLFLSRYSVDTLPYLYIWVAGAVSLQSYLYSHVADRIRRDRLFMFSVAGIFILYLASWVMVSAVGDWFYPVLYVLIELFGSLLIIQFWTLANEVFTTREAKRLFGLVGAGGVFSSVVLGFGVRGVVKLIGTEQLLLLSAALLGFGFFLAWRLSKSCRDEILGSMAGTGGDLRSRIALFADWRRILSNRHLNMVAALIMLLGLVMTLVDFQFKIAARYAFLNQEAQLAGFFGMFYGLTGILSVLVQTLATSRILERFGILPSLLLLPAALLMGAVGLLIHAALWSATLLKGSDSVLRYTINDATVQLLYLPVPARIRGRAKAFVDGIIRPLAIGLAGAALVWIFPHLPEGSMGWIILALVAVWVGVAFGVRRQYLASLTRTLKARRLDFNASGALVPDQAATRLLFDALDDPDENYVLHALDLLPQAAKRWQAGVEPLVRLCDHASTEIRARALRLLGELGSLGHGPVVHAKLSDPNPKVLAAAIDAYCSIGQARAVHTIAPFQDHQDLRVRAAAIVGLIRHGGLDGVLSSAERLKAMLDSSKASERATGARILGDIQVKNFYHPLLQLLVDDDPEVQVAAIQATGKIRCQELMPPLVYRLARRETRAVAIEALSAFGSEATRLLTRVLANPDENLASRLAVPIILGRIADDASIKALLAGMNDPNPDLRGQILETLHRLRIRRPHIKLDRELLLQAAINELRSLYELFFVRHDLDLTGGLLADALSDQHQQGLRRLFRILSCVLPVRAVDAIYSNLNSPNRRQRSNALELLDNLLDEDFKRTLMTLLEPNAEVRRLEEGREFFNLSVQNQSKRLLALLSHPKTWLQACALMEVSQRKELGLRDEVLTCSASSDELVRETALYSLWQLDPPAKVRKTAERHMRDKSIRVSRYAAWLVKQAINAGS